MPTVTYTSRIRIAPGHMPGVQYSIAFKLKDYEPSIEFDSEEHRAIGGGASQFVHLRDDGEWQITTEPMTGSTFDVFHEFLASVGDGQEFTWDFYADSLNADGTPVVVRPVTVQLVDRNVKPKRWKKPGYFEFSFKVRQCDSPLLAENFYFDFDLTKANADILAALGFTYTRTGDLYALRDDGIYHKYSANVSSSHYDAINAREMGPWFGGSVTNNLLYSSDISNGAWPTSSTSKSAATSIIEGGVARTLTPSSTSANITQNIGTFTGSAETYYAIVETSNKVGVAIYNVTTLAHVVMGEFDCTTGVAALYSGTGTVRMWKIRNAGPNGSAPVWLCAVTGTGVSGNSRRVYVYPDRVAGTQSATMHHGQLTAGEMVSPPVVTGAATATRGADVITLTDLPDWLGNATEITIGAVFDLLDSYPLPLSGRLVELNDGSDSDRHLLYRSTTNLAAITTYAGTSQASLSRTIATTGRHRAAYTAKAGRFALSENGASPALDSAGVMPLISQLHLGHKGGGVSPATCYISRVLIDARAYSNAELQGWAA
ncbi:hypothetical protein HPT27_10615 [Permianibacter sp. IMCC34836]|uniref:phage head spike fiber domain-containing protein n=1 Tax=Permianibacter fluminis TaxID=2738515 RepID=UPI00155416CD|nr:hypothetical protein [Permianibacter fluminis]NQD37480.1 hypothetical protein [Permianibacter fluminis]